MIPVSNHLTNAHATTIIAQDGYDVVSSLVKQGKDRLPSNEPSWVKISSGRSMYNMRAGYPYEQTLISLNANESKVFSVLLNNYDFKTGFSTLNTQNMTPSEKVLVSRGYQDLHKRDLVKRVKKFTYLINPDARIHKDLYESHLQIWQSLP